MQFNNAFGTMRDYLLTSAILIYRRTSREDYAGFDDREGGGEMATIHPIALSKKGAATIGPGSGVTLDAIQQLAVSLSQRTSQSTGLFPAELLGLTLARMVWHRPAGPAPMWFTLTSGPAKIVARLKKWSGDSFPQPHLVFVGEPKRLSVFALASRDRPTADTPLYHAPYFNIYEGGNMCAGTSPLPESIGPDMIAPFEKAFFGSNFTHASHRFCTHPNGPAAMWAELRGQPAFPRKYLIPANRTLGSLFTPAPVEPADEDDE